VSLFITGTDTGVGKTHIAARLLHLLRIGNALRWGETDLFWRSS
jgi:dethiobiotin synthetase